MLLFNANYYLIKHDSFICTQSRGSKYCYVIPNSEWTWEQWQWRGTPHYPKPQDWRLTIRLFSVTPKTFVRGVLLLCRDAAGVFYSPSRLASVVRYFQIPKLLTLIYFSLLLRLTLRYFVNYSWYALQKFHFTVTLVTYIYKKTVYQWNRFWVRFSVIS